MLQVEPQALTLISEQAMFEVAHLLRPGHLQVALQNIKKSILIQIIRSI